MREDLLVQWRLVVADGVRGNYGQGLADVEPMRPNVKSLGDMLSLESSSTQWDLLVQLRVLEKQVLFDGSSCCCSGTCDRCCRRALVHVGDVTGLDTTFVTNVVFPS